MIIEDAILNFISTRVSGTIGNWFQCFPVYPGLNLSSVSVSGSGFRIPAFPYALNLVPRVFSLSNMAAAGEKTLAHSRNHVTDLSTESGNLFKMAAKIKREDPGTSS